MHFIDDLNKIDKKLSKDMSDQFDPSDVSSNEDSFVEETQDIEAQKDQYRSVPGLQPIYGDLLKHAIKQNKNAGIYFQSKYYDKLKKDKTLIQRLYRVQRRKDVVKNTSSLLADYEKELSDPNNVKNLRHAIQYLGKLRLRLDEESDPEIMENWFKVFKGKHLSKLNYLGLDPSSWANLGIKERRFPLFRSKCSNLETLSILLRRLPGRNISIEDVTLKLIRGTRKLKNLAIDVVSCAFMGDEQLDVIARALRSRLRTLESLEMWFAALGRITAQGVADLWKSLDKIPNLKKLELVGSYSRDDIGRESVIDDEAFIVLCDVLQRKATTLTTLQLELGCLNLHPDTHKYMSKALVDLLPRLQHLELRFNMRESISDESFPFLGDSFGNSSNSLKILTLYFRHCSNVTSKGAQEFAEKMKKGSFPTMETLKISFTSMPKLRFEGLYAIAEAVSEAFPNVKDLTFRSELAHSRYMDDNYELNNNELQIKAEMMLKEKLKKLKKFRLDWND